MKISADTTGFKTNSMFELLPAAVATGSSFNGGDDDFWSWFSINF